MSPMNTPLAQLLSCKPIDSANLCITYINQFFYPKYTFAIERGKSVLVSVVDTPSVDIAVSASRKLCPSHLGLRLEDYAQYAVRVGVGIRLGLDFIREPHWCVLWLHAWWIITSSVYSCIWVLNSCLIICPVRSGSVTYRSRASWYHAMILFVEPLLNYQ